MEKKLRVFDKERKKHNTHYAININLELKRRLNLNRENTKRVVWSSKCNIADNNQCREGGEWPNQFLFT
jgi:hypothetical protein